MSKGLLTVTITVSTLAAALMAGCATPQENPHYRYSSKMGQQSETSNVQYASTPYQQPAATTQRQVDTQYAQTQYPEPVGFEEMGAQSYEPSYELAGGPSMTPTQDADWDMDMVETGGQNAGHYGERIYQQAELQTPQSTQIQPPMQPQVQQQQPAQPQATPLDGPAQQTVTVSGPIHMAGDDYAPQILTQRNTLIGTQYVVQEGDNVYRLSKSVCASAEDIQSMNNLNAAFTIRAGEIIQLPASRC